VIRQPLEGYNYLLLSVQESEGSPFLKIMDDAKRQRNLRLMNVQPGVLHYQPDRTRLEAVREVFPAEKPVSESPGGIS